MGPELMIEAEGLTKSYGQTQPWPGSVSRSPPARSSGPRIVPAGTESPTPPLGLAVALRQPFGLDHQLSPMASLPVGQ